MRKITDYKVGDILLLELKHKYDSELCTAKVTIVNYNNCGCVTCEGINYDNFNVTGSFSFEPEKIGSTKFGIQRVQKIGHKNESDYHWYPKPGNRAYDLMC